MNIEMLIFCVISFAVSLLLLIAVIREAKDDPTAAGIAVYGGGLCFVSCIISGLGIINFIIERLA
jgi:ABC-type Fe3+-siderophore transport system permease subunit